MLQDVGGSNPLTLMEKNNDNVYNFKLVDSRNVFVLCIYDVCADKPSTKRLVRYPSTV